MALQFLPFSFSRTPRKKQDNPFKPPGGWPPPPSYLPVSTFAALFSAFEFSWRWGLPMDSSLTISWRLLGPTFEADVQASFEKFLNCFRTWLADRAVPIPPVYAYVHEEGPVIGVHTHLALHLPQDPKIRQAFRKWVWRWVRNAVGERRPGAMKMDCRAAKPQNWQHWRAFHYMMKGCDPLAVVWQPPSQGAGPVIFLGDLIAYQMEDPGAPAVRKQAGVSQSIGRGAREFGLPDVGDLHECAKSQLAHPYVDPFRPHLHKKHPALEGWRPGRFVSAFERGHRDVRLLYPQEFITIVDAGWARPSLFGPDPVVQDLQAKLTDAVAYIEELEGYLQIQNLDI